MRHAAGCTDFDLSTISAIDREIDAILHRHDDAPLNIDFCLIDRHLHVLAPKSSHVADMYPI